MGGRFQGWAPPARVWGPWIEIAALFGGPEKYKVDFDTTSEAPSSFDAQIKYWSDNNLVNDIAVGPGSHTFVAGVCLCVSKIRFRSHTLDQVIKISVKP
ncbi:MAG: hypothetical protein COC05_04195 [Gammaproteobacteria bacterium]|nr:MAG: hypothetical protein COC05_04195 [Gammaproteobacteria bacterium]